MTRVSPVPIRRPVRAVLTGGALAASLDIVAAFAIASSRGGNPVRVLQSIASGLIGTAAFQGGAPTAALGLALHFLIATSAAGVYYLTSLLWPVLALRPLRYGTLYGVAVYIVMNFVVVPLSAAPRGPFAWRMAAVLVAVHVACVGVPIAWAVRRYRGVTTA
jgi:hypothetical protein